MKWSDVRTQLLNRYVGTHRDHPFSSCYWNRSKSAKLKKMSLVLALSSSVTHSGTDISAFPKIRNIFTLYELAHGMTRSPVETSVYRLCRMNWMDLVQSRKTRACGSKSKAMRSTKDQQHPLPSQINMQFYSIFPRTRG